MARKARERERERERLGGKVKKGKIDRKNDRQIEREKKRVREESESVSMC